MEKKDILVVGSMNYDSFYALPYPVRFGENLHATAYQTACGGKGANQAVQCAKLGVTTYMLGCLGNDPPGERIKQEMRAYGVTMSLVKQCQTPTGNAAVWVQPSGEVQGVLYGGANMCVTSADIDDAMPLLKRSAIVILQNEIPMGVVSYALKAAKSADCFVMYNAAPALAVDPEAMQCADILLINETEASFYGDLPVTDETSAQQCANRILRRYSGKLIITLGALGSLVVTESKTERIAPIKATAVDTTGAGDSYVGALAYALLEGYDVFQAAKLATRAAAITISSVGAQPSMPDLASLKSKDIRI